MTDELGQLVTAEQVAVYNNFNWVTSVGIKRIITTAANTMGEYAVALVRLPTSSYLEDESNFWRVGIIRQRTLLFSWRK